MDKLQQDSQMLRTHDLRVLNKDHVDVTMRWGGSVLGVQRLSHLGEITIGDGEGASFDISDASIPSAKFALVTLCSEGVRLNIAPGMKLLVDGQKNEQPCFDLALNEKAQVQVGALEFSVQYTNRSKALRVPLLRGLDHLYAKIFSFAMILQLAVIGAMFITPDFGDGLDDDLHTLRNNFDVNVQSKPKVKKTPKAAAKKTARHRKKEGVFGKIKNEIRDTLAKKRGAQQVVKDRREDAQKLASTAIANLGLSGEALATDNVFGAGGSGIVAGLDGLAGASMGSASGLSGQGTRGAGYGGGGKAISIGALGSGDGRGLGDGRRGVDIEGKRKGTTRVRPGKVMLVGSISKAEIERVIRRAQSRIRYCYEKELQKDPNLSGKLVMRWSIGGSGRVTSVKPTQNTLNNRQVSACVKRVVKGMHFPKPRGGGKVLVTYPWVFSSK